MTVMRKNVGHCNIYGFASHGAIVVWFDDDCEEHEIDFAGGEPVEVEEFERILCDWDSSAFHTYQWYANGVPITQDEALQMYLEESR